MYRIYAIRYATRAAVRAENFIGGDPHDTAPMPLDYFVWAVVGADRSFVLDCGFTEATARRRKRTWLRDPVDALRLVGLDPDAVSDVVLSHLHYDHAGCFDRFPAAIFHLQEAEMHYACGRYMRHPRLAHSFEPDDVAGLVKLNFGRRVRMHGGRVDLAPGIALHPVPGHSAGLQCMAVETARGTVVLASDATHFYENMRAGRPFTTAFHIGQMLEAYDTLRALAGGDDRRIIPGHDPQVMARYPHLPGQEGVVACLHEPPSA